MSESNSIRLDLPGDGLELDRLRTALARREREGGTVGANMVLTGSLSAEAYCRFLEDVTGLSRIDDESLERLDQTTFSSLPHELVFDGAMLPIYCAPGAMVVALCDPLEEGLLDDLRLFAGSDVGRVILSFEQMARFYPKLAGRPWQVSAESLQKELVEDEELLFRLAQIDAGLNEAFATEAQSVVICLDQDEQQCIELTRSRRTAAATLDRADAPVMTEAERPRIAGQERGASRHFLSPVERGEAIVAEAAGRVPKRSEPKIIIDMGAFEEPASASSNVLIDPSLLDPDAPLPAPPAADGRELLSVDEEVSVDDDWEMLSQDLDALSFDIDIDLLNTAAGLDPLLPSAGEAILQPGAKAKPSLEAQWFNPRAERIEGRPSEELRNALREMQKANDHEPLYTAMLQVMRSVYARCVVFRIDGDQAVALASSPSPHRDACFEDEQAPRLSPATLPLLVELVDVADLACSTRLPSPANEALADMITGGPALSAILCPLRMVDRAVLLLYADAGPGREAPRRPELWSLLQRELPRALLRLTLRRKTRFRWELRA
ncbi:MAG: hypothetical protein RBU37_20740 [Myxococcota bacterium]|jgi:hypothetical protein|nr:hypothetical protein [Myxococcota bacterium]